MYEILYIFLGKEKWHFALQYTVQESLGIVSLNVLWYWNLLALPLQLSFTGFFVTAIRNLIIFWSL